MDDAAQNIVVLGGIGAGKTTRVMQPLLAQLLQQKCGGLLFDIKGDVKASVAKLSKAVGREVITIGPNHSEMNLLKGLTPEVAASFLKSAFMLNDSSPRDSFFIDHAANLCSSTLGVLSFLPEHYTLQGLYNYLYDNEVRENIQSDLEQLTIKLGAKELRVLKTYMSYQDSIFSHFDEKIKSGVKATIAQALAPFNHPELMDAFCSHTESGPRMESILDGTVYLVDMPLSKWGLGGKVAYTFIKLRFFNVMQSRVSHEEWDQDRPVFFMCDEYQEIVSASKDGLSDLNFWDKSRSSKTIGIISAQSISSFYASLGNRDLSNALLQNFRQKICFRTEDSETIRTMENLGGRAKVQKISTSSTSGSTERKLLDPTTSHRSETRSVTETYEPVLTANRFRRLKKDEAIALLSIEGRSMDDTLELKPLYL